MARWFRPSRFSGQSWAFAILAAVLALATAVTVRAEAWRASEDEQLLLELRSGSYRLGDALRGYQTPAGTCVDFADLIQTLDLPVRLDKKSRRATGWLFAENQRFVLDRDAGTVQTASGIRAIAAGAIHDTPEGWCMDLRVLSGWMGVEFAPDLGNLAVTIKSPQKLPFLEAIERKSRAARLRPRGPDEFEVAQLPRAQLPYRAWRMPSVDVQLQGQWNRSGGAQAQYEVLAGGEALGMSYAARLSGSRFGAPDSLRFRAFRYAPEAGLLGPLNATQVALGDVDTPRGGLTAQGAYGRGAVISNRPINLPSRFGVTALRGALPAGWDAELYRNGELRAYQPDRGDGRYDFKDIELLFGQNDFDVVLYGPQGQIRHARSSVPVGAEAIPTGKTWYWAGIAQDRRDLIDFTSGLPDPHTGWRWGVGVERGIDRRTSAGLEYQSLLLAGRRRDYLEAMVRRSLGGMLVEALGAQQLGAGRSLRVEALGKAGGVRFDARALWVDGNFDSELVRAQQQREYSLRLNGSLRLAGWSLPIEAGVRRARARDGREVDEWSVRGSAHIARISVGVEWLCRVVRGGGSGAENPGNELMLIGNTALGPVRLRGSARCRLSGEGGQPRGFAQSQIVAEAPLGAASTLRASYEYDATARRHEFALGLVRQFDRLAVRADGRADNHGRIGAALTLGFSLGPDPVDGGWRISRNRLAETGQAAIEVFRDENGDGDRQANEAAVEGVSIDAGFRHSDRVTNAAGRAVIDGLQPYVPVLVSIDSGSLPDPLLRPKGRGLVVVPRPGVRANLMLPLALTGEIELVLVGADGEPGGGASIELTDLAGRVLLRAASEFDGYVLFDAVPYGDYRVQLMAATAASLGLRPVLAANIRIDRAHPSARLGRVRLELAPLPSQVATAAP